MLERKQEIHHNHNHNILLIHILNSYVSCWWNDRVFSFSFFPSKERWERWRLDLERATASLFFFFSTKSTASASKEKKCLSIVDTTLLDRVLFMILHHVCFPYLESSWSGWDILILGQAGIAAQVDQNENKTCLDHNRKCYLLHSFALQPFKCAFIKLKIRKT